MTRFQDLFSAQSGQYAKFRPTYPPELFGYLASLCPERTRAWDVGTGNGQAAIAVADHFQAVLATDPSEKQIEKAIAHERVRYGVAPAEATSIESRSVDLITAATAAHWFDLDRFYEEARRVAKPGAVIALFTYGHNRKMDDEINPLIDRIESEILGPYWAPQIRLIWEEYRTIPFPFEEIETPEFKVQKEMNLAELLGYFSSWSAFQKYVEKNGKSPLDEVEDDLLRAWGAPEKRRTMTWSLFKRVGRIRSST